MRIGSTRAQVWGSGSLAFQETIGARTAKLFSSEPNYSAAILIARPAAVVS